MVQEVKDMYKKLGRGAKIPEKALDILHKSGQKTLKKGVPYTIAIIYAVIDGRYEDYQVDNAFIQACDNFTKERKVINSDIARRAKLLSI